MSRVLVTGARGFIGRHTLAPLLDAGLEVHAVTSRPVPAVPPAGLPAVPPAEASATWPPAGVRWHRADLLDRDRPGQLIDEVRPTHLLHLAWCTRPGAFWTASENLDWVHASLSLLRAFGAAGGRRAVLAGTCAEYAWQRRTHCVEESPTLSAPRPAPTPSVSRPAPTPLRPATLYGAAKHGLHVIAEGWARQVGVALAWGRVFHVYGPHEHPDRLVSGVTRALLGGEETLCTEGRQVRDFLYAPDLGRAFAALLSGDVAGPVNLASGKPVTVAAVVRALARAAGRPELVRLGALPAKSHEPERLTAEVARLRQEVGWTPSVGLCEGAERTVAWWRQTEAGPRPTAPSQAPAG